LAEEATGATSESAKDKQFIIGVGQTANSQTVFDGERFN